jgi:hypothetical protein
MKASTDGDIWRPSVTTTLDGSLIVSVDGPSRKRSGAPGDIKPYRLCATFALRSQTAQEFARFESIDGIRG